MQAALTSIRIGRIADVVQTGGGSQQRTVRRIKPESGEQLQRQIRHMFHMGRFDLNIGTNKHPDSRSRCA